MSKVMDRHSCGGCSAGVAVANEPVAENDPFVVLVGAPNSGKTTLYNQLTGSNFRAVNYPGATVDYFIGESLEKHGDKFQVLDSPGTYSLFPKSPEERVTRDVLFSHPKLGAAHTVIAVVDASHLSRHLFVVKQLKEAGFHVVVALTMMDLIDKSAHHIHVEGLVKQLGCDVVPVYGLTGKGVDKLVSTVNAQLLKPSQRAEQIKAWSTERHEAEQKDVKVVSDSVLRAREKIQKVL